MTQRTKTLLTWGAILAPLFLPLLGWGAMRYDASNMKADRFVTDSSVFMAEDAAFKREVRDGLRAIRDGQDSINLRLTQIQCGRRVQDGCR